MDLSRQLFLENGWTMPRGLMKSQDRDPRNFTLDQWQQLKRIGVNPVHLKEAIQDCWAVSKDAKSFSRELETRGLYLAKGDRGGHVVITHDGKIFAVSRVVGKRTKDVTAKLGDPDKNGDLPTVQKALERIAQVVSPKLKEYIAEAKRLADNQLKPLNEERLAMMERHREERQKLDTGQKLRQEAETRERSARLPTGVKGVWHRLTGEYAKVRARNELEAVVALRRDREQRHDLVSAQLGERQDLQTEIHEIRSRLAKQLLELHRDASHYREYSSETGREPSSEFSRSFDRSARGETGRTSERGSARSEGHSAARDLKLEL